MADRVYLHQQFLKHKPFLQKLYSGQDTNKVLNGATDNELNVLLKILHLLGDAQILVKSDHRDVLKKSQREVKLAKLGSRVFFKEVMKKSRQEKLKVVKHFTSLYPHLLHYLLH